MATKKRKTPTRAGFHLDQAVQREIVALCLVAGGGISLVALAGAAPGFLSDGLAVLLRQVFGWGAYLVALTLLAGGLLLLWRNLHVQLDLPWQRLVGAEALFVVALALSHMAAANREDGLALAQEGGGGGYIGWTVSYFLIEAIGDIPALLLLLGLGVLSVALVLRVSRQQLIQAGQWAARTWEAWRVELTPAPVEAETPAAPPARPVVKPKFQPLPVAEPSAPRPTRGPVPLKIETTLSEPKRAPRRRKSLPSLDLLQPEVRASVDPVELKRQAEVIGETLESLGVPARVVECRTGPRVTQFGVEPGYIKKHGAENDVRIRVHQVTALANDLALALAAPSIRIEAPVPGRAVIGIEIPNRHVTQVALRGLVETKEYADQKGPLKIALGRDVAGSPVVVDIGKMPHLLVAGATGSGKSVCLNALIACLLLSHTPETLRFILIDPKRVELVHFNDIPHLLGPTIVEVDQAVAALKWATREMERRYRLFAEAGARNLTAYNRTALTQGASQLPYIIIAIDEMAELMMVAPEEIERNICRIAQLARATGIHLVIATQRPSVDVVTGLIKANFPARICFAVTSLVDSRVVLDTPGAEKLLGKGDMLFMAPDSSKLSRIQGCFVSDEEIQAIVQFWREKAPSYLTLLEEKVPWVEQARESSDDLLPEAIKLVQEHQQASVSFLQRRLRIGYPRAARLMDLLEQRGVVGPQVSGGLSRQVRLDHSADD